MVRVRATRTLERAATLGFYRIAGCDEVGRGVWQARCRGCSRHSIRMPTSPGLLTRRYGRRARAPQRSDHRPRVCVVGGVRCACRDRRAEYPSRIARAMRRAVLALAPLPDAILVDAFRIPDLHIAQRGVLHGDRRCAAIAAASIVAKVSRDRQMLTERERPAVRADKHKGYYRRTPGRRRTVRYYRASPFLQASGGPV